MLKIMERKLSETITYKSWGGRNLRIIKSEDDLDFAIQEDDGTFLGDVVFSDIELMKEIAKTINNYIEQIEHNG